MIGGSGHNNDDPDLQRALLASHQAMVGGSGADHDDPDLQRALLASQQTPGQGRRRQEATVGGSGADHDDPDLQRTLLASQQTPEQGRRRQEATVGGSGADHDDPDLQRALLASLRASRERQWPAEMAEMRSRCQISQSDAESYLEIAAGNVDVAIELWENSWELVETAESSLTMDIGAGVGGVDVDMQRLVYESVMNSNFPRTRSERTTRIYKMLKKIHQSRSFSLTKPNDEYVVMTMSVDPTSSRPSNFRYTALNGCDCSHSQFRMLTPIQEFLQENYRNQVSTRGTFCYRSSMSGKLAYDMKYLEHIIRSLPSSVQKIVIEIRDAEYTEPIKSFRCESNERDYMYKGQPFEAAFTAAYGLPRIQMQQCADPQTINGCTTGQAHGHDFTPVLLEFICRLYILLHDRRTPLGLELRY